MTIPSIFRPSSESSYHGSYLDTSFTESSMQSGTSGASFNSNNNSYQPYCSPSSESTFTRQQPFYNTNGSFGTSSHQPPFQAPPNMNYSGPAHCQHYQQAPLKQKPYKKLLGKKSRKKFMKKVKRGAKVFFETVGEVLVVMAECGAFDGSGDGGGDGGSD